MIYQKLNNLKRECHKSLHPDYPFQDEKDFVQFGQKLKAFIVLFQTEFPKIGEDEINSLKSSFAHEFNEHTLLDTIGINKPTEDFKRGLRRYRPFTTMENLLKLIV